MRKRLILPILILAAIVITTGIRAYSGHPASDEKWTELRLKLVESLRGKGITDTLVLKAMSEIPRHSFVPANWRAHSYLDRPLSIGHGQTISQPYIVAYMCQALKLTDSDKVLEIGTGSGYHAAVMSLICNIVYTIEIVPELGRSAAVLLNSLGYENISVMIGDGYKGWEEHAPFDAVILTAAPPQIPQPLLEQLKVGGRLIAPVGVDWQELVLIYRTEDGYRETKLLPVRFVPMTGEAQRTK